MQIAIATYRHGGDDGADEIVDVSVPPSGGAITGSGCLDSLPVAPGGPNKFQLDDIDIRAPIAGLYVRLERLLAKQVRLLIGFASLYGLLPTFAFLGRCGMPTRKPANLPALTSRHQSALSSGSVFGLCSHRPLSQHVLRQVWITKDGALRCSAPFL